MDEKQEDVSVVDYIDEFHDVLASFPWRRWARQRLRQILRQVRREHATLSRQKDSGEEMTTRQWAYLYVLELAPANGCKPPGMSRKRAAALLKHKLEEAVIL